VSAADAKRGRFYLTISLCVLWAFSVAAQISSNLEVPSQFKLDMETAARLRPQLTAESVPANGRYATGRLVFERLVQQVKPLPSIRPVWELRIVEDGELNAYASPDGTVYVESGLAHLAEPSAGLWAAILSHEIAHVLRRDWARRYLYEKQLESGSGAAILLGDPGMPSGSWTDSGKASEDLGKFCRQLEIDADRDGLSLMAKAGYHPDFAPSLHHLLHAHSKGAKDSLYAMHPCWEERDRELSGAYTLASIEFAHLWREWYASPGGNPPVVVFAEPPLIKKTRSREWEIQVPMRCQNLVGAVEVVLRADSAHRQPTHASRPSGIDDSEVRQLTGCTSPQTSVVFTAADLMAKHQPIGTWTDVYVIDAWGSVLARTDLPKLPH